MVMQCSTGSDNDMNVPVAVTYVRCIVRYYSVPEALPRYLRQCNYNEQRFKTLRHRHKYKLPRKNRIFHFKMY